MLQPIELHPDAGLTPDEAAVIAVLINPALRAARDQRGSAAAALLQAGLLPNPVLTYSSDFTTGGNTAGTFNAYGATLSWDWTALISHPAKVQAAELSAASIDLSVAWAEWQTAEAAKQAVYDLVSLQAQLSVLEEIDGRLQENFTVVGRAAGKGFETAVELAAAEAAARDARASVLQSRRDVEHQWLQLTRALGLPSDARPKLRDGLALASSFDAPGADELSGGLEQRRIDLLALRKGYASEEQTLRAAVLDQFPKINFGVNDASDNTNVHSVGLVATIDLPVFDRNQGAIAAERATRQRLFDEYVGRVFDGRADIAAAVADLRALNQQIADAQAAVPNLQHLVDAYRQAMDNGNADVLSYYVAWNNLAQKRLGVLRLQQQLADTRIALELAAGRYFPDPPAKPPTTRPTSTSNSTTTQNAQ
jgi:cobalt-zinc-cadmium efflux system outer membrane protein